MHSRDDSRGDHRAWALETATQLVVTDCSVERLAHFCAKDLILLVRVVDHGSLAQWPRRRRTPNLVLLQPDDTLPVRLLDRQVSHREVAVQRELSNLQTLVQIEIGDGGNQLLTALAAQLLSARKLLSILRLLPHVIPRLFVAISR